MLGRGLNITPKKRFSRPTSSTQLDVSRLFLDRFGWFKKNFEAKILLFNFKNFKTKISSRSNFFKSLKIFEKFFFSGGFTETGWWHRWQVSCIRDHASRFRDKICYFLKFCTPPRTSTFEGVFDLWKQNSKKRKKFFFQGGVRKSYTKQ